jgi:hypothetical protein
MAQANFLSTIIRQVTEHAKPAGDREALVTIDARTGEVVSQPGLLETLIGDFRYFLVSNNRDPNKVIKGTKRVKYKEGTGEITFAIEYTGGCQPGNEWWLAQCFFKSPPSEDTVNNSLVKWLMEYFSSGTFTIDDFYSEKASACATLAHKAGREFGLDLSIRLELEGTDALETIDSGQLLVFSRMKDSDDEEGIEFRADLEVDPQRTLRALLSQNKTFGDLLEKGVRKYISDCLTLNAFYKEFPNEQATQELRDHLNNLLRPWGRKVGRISLKPDHTSIPSKVFNSETVIEYRHHEYPDPIKISVSVLMVLQNSALYKAKGSPKLEAWLDKSLREVITITLFGISYVDLLLDFPQLKKRIDALINQRAAEIGYNIEQLMTVLHLEPFEWLKRVDVEIKGTATNNGHMGEAMFETSLSGFYVGLEIILTARVKELRGISRYLSTKQDVPQKMKEEILRLVRKFMHGTNPERFYMRYARVRDAEVSDELSFEEELRGKIESLLKEDFNAEVIELILKPTQTELTSKLYEVSKGSHDFNAPAELGRFPGAPTIIVKGSFKVIGVRGWDAFKECDARVEAIRKRIEDSMRASLRAVRDDQLMFSEQNGFDALVQDSIGSARELVSDEFGLAIKITTVYWDWDDRLKQLGREQGKVDLTSVQERILRLKDYLLDLYENDPNPEAIRDTEERIRRLSATLNPALASSIGIKQIAETKTPKSLSSSELDDVAS